mgnify:CR=1 FL=1
MLKTGSMAPEFQLSDQDGNIVNISDYVGQKVLLWFYPKASTPGWTIQGQGLRDEFQKFKDKNTVILGMSADSVKAQKNFTVKCDFQFQMLSDPDKETIRSYDAIGMKKMYGKEYEGILRIAYLVDEQSNIEKAYEKVSPKTHACEVLKDLGY